MALPSVQDRSGDGNESLSLERSETYPSNKLVLMLIPETSLNLSPLGVSIISNSINTISMITSLSLDYRICSTSSEGIDAMPSRRPSPKATKKSARVAMAYIIIIIITIMISSSSNTSTSTSSSSSSSSSIIIINSIIIIVIIVI